MPRAIVNATITFGLVAVPVKVYTAASSEAVSFNMLSKDGSRLKQQMVDSAGAVVPREETQKGYEFAKDQYVVFTADELKALESSDTSQTMDIQEFVDAASVPTLVEKTYFLGPGKGGDKSYSLLAKMLKKLDKAAIAQWTNRGKEHLVAIQAHEGGLKLQQLYYANEHRDFSEIEVATFQMSEAEEQMGALLVEQMSTGKLDITKYEDRYAKRVKEAVEAKTQGQTAAVVTSVPQKTVMDLVAALKASLGQGTVEPAPEEPKKKTRKPRSKK